jgi:hypothetical protein
MAFDLIALGTVPSGDVPAEGVKLRVRCSGPDFNPYVEVVVEFDVANDGARAYANRRDREAPTRRSRTAQIALER